MLPSEPESSRKGGTSTSSAGYTRNDEKRFSIVSPATMSTKPAIASTGIDSRTMRARIGRCERIATTIATSPIAAQITAITGVTTSKPTRYVARKSVGSVTMSPAAVTIGAATLSRSQPRRTLSAATPTVIASTTADDRTPPSTEITTKSAIEIVWSSPNPTDTVLASTARTTEIDSDSATAAARF